MSRRDRSAADTRRPEWSRRDRDAKAVGPSIVSIVIPAALALFAGAVFFAQLVSPSGFLMSVAGLEAGRLSANDKLGPAAKGPSWNSLYALLREETSRLPVWKNHLAVREAFNVLVSVDLGRRDPKIAAEIAKQALDTDPDNLVTRLTYAAVLDAPATSTQSAESAIVRFSEFRESVEGSKPATTSTLYNEPIDLAWLKILQDNLRRRDTARALSRFAEHYEVTQHYAALPILQLKLTALADALTAAGDPVGANLCRQWLVRMLVGVMQSEPDAGTQLLCADLLARTLEETQPELAKPLHELRDKYHASLADAPIDMADPSRTPVVYAPNYRFTLTALVVTLVFAACALGTGLTFAATVLMTPIAIAARAIAERRGTGQSESPPVIHRRRAIARILLCLLGPALLSILLAVRITSDGVFSEYWLYVTFICSAFAGAMFAAAHSLDASRCPVPTVQSTDARNSSPSPWPMVAALLALPLLAILAPPSLVAHIARWCDLKVSLLNALLILFPLLAIFCIWRLRAHLRTLAFITAVTCMLNISVAWGALWALHLNDPKIQPPITTSIANDLDIRLGADWRNQYLSPIKTAYDMTTP